MRRKDDHLRAGDFLPTAALETLRLRAALLATVRRFFEDRGFLEVETPLLSHDVVVDAFLEPFATRWMSEAGAVGAEDETAPAAELFLQTSPEFGMKRLLVAGATALYQVTRAFRNGEFGRYHNPEFTMVEWYRVGDTHHTQMEFTQELVVEVFRRAGELRQEGQECRTGEIKSSMLQRPFLRLSYDEAFEKYAGTRVLGLSDLQLGELARRRGLTPPPGLADDDRDGWLNLLLAELVEPRLGRQQPVFVYDYPASQAALAQVRQDEPAVAERFELYIAGLEICNGYHELTDPQELRERMRRQAAIRAREGRRRLPEQNRLLEAMEAGLPPCAGVALGFDRLVMVSLGAMTLAEVVAFPFDRA